MKEITYKDLQLKLEIDFESSIKEDIDRTFVDTEDKTPINIQEERHFYNLIKYAIDMEAHRNVASIINRITKELGLDNIAIKFYLYQDDSFNVNCFSRKKETKINELYIFVSQHFFNNLNEDEQVGIIGHEISHQLFDHFKYPTANILNLELDVNTVGDLKHNLIYRSKISEITSDLIGLASCNFNSRAYSTALIKHTTGLFDNSSNEFGISSLIDMVLVQYDKFSNDPFMYDLQSTHPLMPLRVKIVNEIIDTNLVKYFGKNVSNSNYIRYKSEFNSRINDVIKTIYPEIFPDKDDSNDVLILMSIAIVLADGKIDDGEIKYMKSLFKKSHRTYNEYMKIIFAQKDGDYTELINTLIKKCIKITKKESFEKNMIIPIIRKLILVSASDGIIRKAELKVLFKFAKNFSITKRDIVLILSTQYKV